MIFICNYDPFSRERCIYRFENLCTDDPSLKLGDDTAIIIVNPYGTNDGKMGRGFAAFLEYLRSGKATDSYTEALAEEVDSVRASEEWRREYMLLLERDRENQNIGEQRGIKIGQEIGQKIGEQNGAKKDAAELFKNGASYDLVRRSISKEKISDEELQEIYDSAR